MIQVSGIGKRYGDLVAVNDLSFEICRGETFGLLGPNGAGKSTTINMIVGLTKTDQGSVLIGDASDSHTGQPDVPEVRRRIGISPQALSLYEELTARENLNFFGSLYGLSGYQLADRTKWCLSFSGLEDRKNDRVQTYSGGMKRRLNIAAALIHEPEILLLDEPTVGVDPQSRNHIFESIEKLRDVGVTLIYTTHYMEEAQRLCDRVAIVDHGKLLAIDSVDQLIEQHGGTSIVSAEVNDEIDSTAFQNDLVSHFEREKNQVRFASAKPFDAIAELTKSGVQFQTLNLKRPDLESVFLTLTGRNLRD